MFKGIVTWFKEKVAGKELDRLWVLEQRIRDMEAWMSAEPKLMRAAKWLSEKDNPKDIMTFRTEFEAEFGSVREVGRRQRPESNNHRMTSSRSLNSGPSRGIGACPHHHYHDEDSDNTKTRSEVDYSPKPQSEPTNESSSSNYQSSMDTSYD